MADRMTYFGVESTDPPVPDKTWFGYLRPDLYTQAYFDCLFLNGDHADGPPPGCKCVYFEPNVHVLMDAEGYPIQVVAVRDPET